MKFVSKFKLVISIFSAWAVGFLTAAIIEYGINFEYGIGLLLGIIAAVSAGFSAHEDMYDDIEELE